jgi:hypothetical protein
MAYLGTQPNDVKKNTGLYTPSEILQLTKDGSWGGSLELIEEQTVSGNPNNVDFINLANNPYDVYFLTARNVKLDSNGQIYLRLSNDNGSSFISSSSYDFANMSVDTSGNDNNYRDTSSSFIGMELNTGNTSNDSVNFYIYFYNLLDSSKYSFTTNHFFRQYTPATKAGFGGSALAIAETHNAIRLFGESSKLQTSGTYSLFGIKDIS